VTPRLLRTRAGELSVQLAGEDLAPTDVGSIFRLLDFIPGHCYPRMTAALAVPAGHLVGRFHVAVSDLRHDFRFSRPGAHALSQHVDKLRQALADAARPDFSPPESPVPPAFPPFAEALLRHAERVELTDARVATLPRRICHGDLKVSNLRFDEAGHGVCLLDLDTLGLLPLPLELGDALRSWCNTSPLGEDSAEARFDLALFEGALSGYAQSAGGLITPDEQAALVAGLERIAFQLAVRFAVDVVRQSYFRFRVDPVRHPTRAAHNLLRAQGQLSLAQAVAAGRSQAESVVARLFRRT
jgi:Ser/Thr protein kinase RdoA (MazF antagonist)